MKFVGILFLCLWGLLIYSNSFQNSFHFDDFHSIVNNSGLKEMDWGHLWSIEPTRFITYSSFALNHLWGRTNVEGYHAVNILLHIACAVLVWRLLLLTFKTPRMIVASVPNASWIALFAAFIFVAHPLQTQPVNYIYQRAVLLAAFFYLASLILYIKASLGTSSARYYYAASLGCGILSIFSKENAVSLPVMILFYQWFFVGRQSINIKRICPFFAILLLMPLAWHRLDLRALTELFKDAGLGVTPFQYALTQTKVVLTYLKLLVLPFDQRVEYDFALVNSLDMTVAASLLFLGCILAIAVMLRKNFGLLTFGICWFFITLFPEASLWPNKDLVFEHRLYLPLMGFAVLLSSGIFSLSASFKPSVAIRILILLVMGYSFLTYQRNKVWLNEMSLWDDAVRKSPKNPRVYLNRGAAYQKQGDLDRALEDYNRVIGLGIVDAVTLSNRGLIFAQKGAYDLALANFDLAIQINPSYAGTYVNRAYMYKLQGRDDLGVADANKARELLPR